MARGNEIVVSANPCGLFMEGYLGVGLTARPGMLLQADPTVALKGGRQTFKFQTPGADGGNPQGALWILLANNLIGGTQITPYNAGDRIFLYTPLAGEEVNVLVANVGGANYTPGQTLMIQNGTGKLIASAGAGVSSPFLLNEAVVSPTSDTLVWVTK